MIRKGECKKCGKCCKYERVCMTDLSEEGIYYYSMRAAYTKNVDGALWMMLYSRCPYLLSDNTCSIYNTDKYPEICDRYPDSQAAVYIEDCGYYWEEEDVS